MLVLHGWSVRCHWILVGDKKVKCEEDIGVRVMFTCVAVTFKSAYSETIDE